MDASLVGDCAHDALDFWQSATGLTFARVAATAEPRIVIRAAGPDELNVAAGLGLVYRTYPNNSARLGVVKILTREATCSAPSALFRHEIGHAIGIFGHVPGGLMSSPLIGTTASQRESNTSSRCSIGFPTAHKSPRTAPGRSCADPQSNE